MRAQLAAGDGGSGGKLLPYNSKAYKSLVHQMPRQVLRLLRSGQAVFLLDADVTLLAKPLERRRERQIGGRELAPAHERAAR